MVTLTEQAADKVKSMLSDSEDAGLRIVIKPGGCSGFSYGLALDERKPNDIAIIQHGVSVFVDAENERLVDGAQIDYLDDLSGTGFLIHNPNAISTCGCGSSFRTKEDAGQPGSCD